MDGILVKNWTAGASLISALILMIPPHRLPGQPEPADPSSIESLEHLEIPDYPPLPRQARILAIQTVKVLLSDQAAVQNIESALQDKHTTVEKDFREGAEKALVISS
jgi:hypothetical protein